MGYLLELYGLEMSEIQSLLGSGDAVALREILEAEPRLFVASPGVAWKGALRELILGPRGRLLAARGLDPAGLRPEEAPPEEALALVALVRARGARVGEVIHTSRGSAGFRRLFDSDFAPSPFRSPKFARRLLGRPLFGLVQRDYPYWGWLRKEELAALLGDLTLDSLPHFEDPDHEAWMVALCEGLLEVRELGTDLVTLYL